MQYNRIPKSNLHTHTCFCDGKDSPEQIVRAAIDGGMEVIGFSGHSYTAFETSYCMTPHGTQEYREEILRLRSLYGDRIGILLGLEQDLYSDAPADTYDYLIGSAHFVLVNGEYCAVDDTREIQLDTVRRHFGGSFYRYAKAYYETVAEVADKTACDIVGHFDLITKFNGDGSLFDESDPQYIRYAIDALDALLEKDVIFEINTGASSRGYRRAPYPAPILLRRIGEKRGRITFSSDAHSASHLMHGFYEAMGIARASGCGSVWMMTRNGWRECPL